MAKNSKSSRIVRALQYIGPDYTKGLLIAGKKYDPKSMTPDQVQAFLEQHPGRAEWWTAPETESAEPEHQPE